MIVSERDPRGQPAPPVPPPPTANPEQYVQPPPYYPPQFHPPAGDPPKRRPTSLLVGGAAVLVVVFAAAGIGTAFALRKPARPTPATSTAQIVTVVGTLTLADSPGVLNLDDVHCRGMGGYDDIAEGSQVTVTDEHGTVVGLGELNEGVLDGSGPTRQCRFAFTVNNIPAGHAIYGVSVSHRGTIQVRADDLDNVSLTLGD